MFLYFPPFVIEHGGTHITLKEKRATFLCSKLLRFHLFAGNEGDVSAQRSRFQRGKNRFCKLSKEAKIKDQKALYMRVCMSKEQAFSPTLNHRKLLCRGAEKSPLILLHAAETPHSHTSKK